MFNGLCCDFNSLLIFTQNAYMCRVLIVGYVSIELGYRCAYVPAYEPDNKLFISSRD